MKIIITKNYQEMSKRAAELIIKQIKAKSSSVLGLATGSTPIGLYKELVKAYKKGQVNFKNVTTFNLDEYVGLTHNDKQSYYYFIYQHFLKHVNIKSRNIFIPDSQERNLKKECADYEKLIKKKKIDLLILGIGLNGHIGFNEPGSNFNSQTRVVNLKDSTRRANAKFFKTKKDVPKRAITMGIRTIMSAKKIILLAKGREKARILTKALQGKITKKVPASVLQRHPNLIVILDKRAGSYLSK